MGRGRQKAKHMKVARKLKYFSPDTDLDALQRELTSSGDLVVDIAEDSDEEDEDDGDEWEDRDWSPSSGSPASAWSEYED